MPFTPFHIGPALFVGLLFRFLFLPSFIVGSIIVDIEPFLVLMLNLNYPLHGFFHSFIGGSIIAIIISFLIFRLTKPISQIMLFIKLEQKSSLKIMILSSLAGVYIHIILDSIIYSDIKPFYPLDWNPLYNVSMLVSFEIYTFCTILFFTGIMLYLYRLKKS